MLKIRRMDYFFNLEKQDFKRIEFEIEREECKKSNLTMEEYKEVINKAKEDFNIIEKFFDENFPLKKWTKMPYGSETPDYITAGFVYSTKGKYPPEIECQFTCNFSSWNITKEGFPTPYFRVIFEMNCDSNIVIQFFQKMLQNLNIGFTENGKKVYNLILKRLESRKSITPHSMFTAPFEGE